MKRLILVLLTLVITNSCQKDDPVAIHGNIGGIISEEGTNIAIEGVTVEIIGRDQTIKTGSNGTYKVNHIPADKYIVIASKRGYISDTKSIDVVPEKTVQGDFSLRKDIPVATPNSILLSNEFKEVSLELHNTRSGEMSFTTELSKPWLSVTPTNSTIAELNKRIIKISVDFTKIEFGTYDEKLIINVGGASLSIPIQIIYNEPPYISFNLPQKDETFKMGEIMPVSWNSNLNGKAKIELLRYSSVMSTIVTEVENTEGGNFNWTIPALVEANYQLIITSIENPDINLISHSFKLIEGPTPPTVLSGNPTELTSSTLIISGIIEDLGIKSNQVDQHGHVFSNINPLPTISDLKTTLGVKKETGKYESSIDNLTAGETYYFRAYATNNKGTSYGDVITLVIPANTPVIETSAITNVTNTSAVTGGSISSDGGNDILERGICWGKNPSVDIYSNHIKDPYTNKGAYSSKIENLDQGTTYYVRAYARNSSGISYGEVKSFITIGGLPTVSTNSAEADSPTSISLTGNVLDDGGKNLVSYGFCLSKSSNPTTGDDKYEVGSNTNTTFQYKVEDLMPETTYYIRAYATNTVGTSYGDELSVLTPFGGYINFSSPYESEVVMPNSVHEINWNTNYSNRRVLMQVSNNDSFLEISDNTYVGSNNYSWFIEPHTPAGNNTIKIIDYETFKVLGESKEFEVDEYFTITKPETNAILQTNEVVIEWIANYSTSFKIDLYNGSKYISEISSNVNSKDGKYIWNAKDDNITTARNYRIIITDENNIDNFKVSGTFELIENGSFTDSRDGRTYKTISFEGKTWMAENIRYEGGTAGSSSICDQDNGFGYLKTVEFENIAPEGWHISSDNDWIELESYLGADAGYKLKSKNGWELNGNDIIGFNVKPQTYFYRYLNSGQGYPSCLEDAYFWTSTKYDNSNYSYYYRRIGNGNYIKRSHYSYTGKGRHYYKIRCVKDE